MAVLETGVMFGGVPIVRVNYYNDSSTDSLLTAGLLEAIQLFAVEIFGDETESFKMKKYCILLHNFVLSNNQKVILYSICDTIDRPKTMMLNEWVSVLAVVRMLSGGECTGKKHSILGYSRRKGFLKHFKRFSQIYSRIRRQIQGGD